MDYPILMADIIESSNKEPKTLMKQFKKVVSYINTLEKKHLLSPLTITLGDEFQGIVDSALNTIQIIFEIEEYIIQNDFEFKLRYVLQMGEIDTNINTKNAYEMLGQGLTDARRELNEFKGANSRFLINLGQGDDIKELILNNAFRVYNSFVKSWTFKDYKLVAEFLKTPDYKIVADSLNINRSTAWRRHRSLNISEYEAIKAVIILTLKHER